MTTTTLVDRAGRRAEWRGVIAMAVPTVITTSSRAFMDVADYVMITWLHVPEAQAAILPAQIVMWSYMIMGLGIVSMINTFVSQSLGRKAYRECSAYAWQTLYVAAFFAVAALGFLPFLPAAIAAFGHPPGVQALELAYTKVALFTTGPTILAEGLGWFFMGIHRPKTTMWSAIEANVINIVVGYVLIFGHLGFDAMGITGAAWGMFVAVCYRATRLTLTLLSPTIARTFHSRDTWRPSWSRLVRLVRVGSPFALQWLSDVAVWAIFVLLLIGKRFPMPHLIATNTAWQYMRISFMPTYGLAQALQALVGRSIGAGDPDRAVREARTAARLAAAYMGALSLLYAFCGTQLIALFSDDPEVIAIGRWVMVCAACFELFDALGLVYSSALRGAGDTFTPAAIFVVCNWMFVVLGGWFMAVCFPGLGSLGPWIAASVLFVVTGFLLWARWRVGGWRRIDLFGAGDHRLDPVPGFPAVGPVPTEPSGLTGVSDG